MTFDSDLGTADTEALVARLVRAGRADGPSAKTLDEAPAAVVMLLAMHGAAAGAAHVTGAAGVPLAKAAASPLVLLKWIGVGALASSSALVLVEARHSESGASSVAAPVSAPAPRAAPRTAPTTAQLAPQPVLPAALPTASSLAPVVPSAPRDDVAREVASLDAARQALLAGNAGEALRTLSALEQLPRRALAPEATLLRVRALLAQGNRAEAKRVTEAFCAAAPSSPQAGVLRSLIANSEIQVGPSRL